MIALDRHDALKGIQRAKRKEGASKLKVSGVGCNRVWAGYTDDH
jgi:hypothetical protein